jgi:biopolymer transport protein ExbD
MAFKGNDDDDIMADINMTPLIDIMLVLLIIFMVTSSVAVDHGLDITMPKIATEAKNQDEGAVVVYLGSDGSLAIDGEKIQGEKLGEEIAKAIVKKNSGFVLFKGDKSASLENILNVMDAAKQNGATKFAIGVEEAE